MMEAVESTHDRNLTVAQNESWSKKRATRFTYGSSKAESPLAIQILEGKRDSRSFCAGSASQPPSSHVVIAVGTRRRPNTLLANIFYD